MNSKSEQQNKHVRARFCCSDPQPPKMSIRTQFGGAGDQGRPTTSANARVDQLRQPGEAHSPRKRVQMLSFEGMVHRLWQLWWRLEEAHNSQKRAQMLDFRGGGSILGGCVGGQWTPITSENKRECPISRVWGGSRRVVEAARDLQGRAQMLIFGGL